jgi:integrase
MKKRRPTFVIRQGSARVVAYVGKRRQFCLCYYKHAGAPRSRETLTGESRARARAEEIAIALANGRADLLELSGPDRDSYLHAKSLLPPGVSLPTAIEEWNALRDEKRSRGPVPSSAQILDELLSDLREHQRSDRHCDGLRRDLEKFVAMFPKLQLAREDQISAYLRSASAANVGARRRDNLRDKIVQLFRFARRRGYLPEDRKSEAEKIGKIKPGHDVQTWTPHEAALLLEHISAKWLPWLALGLFAGLRTSEILRLDWSAVKFDEGVISISRKIARKIRISRLVRISENLAAWLAPFRDFSGAVYSGGFKTNENLKAAELNCLRKLLGLPRRDNANRHSFGSHRLAILKSFDQVALEMGNSARKVREDYNDPKSESEARKYFALKPTRDPKICQLVVS